MFEGIALGTCITELPKAAASTMQKCIMAGIFALITPIGMGIGIGVLNNFNGNDPSTIVAIGTLDALSAGILAWVGIVEMLARDWMHGKLLRAGLVRTACAMGALVAGMVLMSVLGKWA
jgi:zinc transporter 1/2/3